MALMKQIIEYHAIARKFMEHTIGIIISKFRINLVTNFFILHSNFIVYRKIDIYIYLTSSNYKPKTVILPKKI